MPKVIEWLYCKTHGWFTRPFRNQRAYAGYCPMCLNPCPVSCKTYTPWYER